jgi:hypothetical protein
LAELPEQWRRSSAWMRRKGRADWLMPLHQLVGTSDPELARKLYGKAGVYRWRRHPI